MLMTYLNLVKPSGLNKQQVLEMLLLIIKEKVILFDQKYYSQIDGVTMGTSLGPTLGTPLGPTLPSGNYVAKRLSKIFQTNVL